MGAKRNEFIQRNLSRRGVNNLSGALHDRAEETLTIRLYQVSGFREEDG
jgi:hypothetical protein